jgi:hypothetical protein
MKATLTTLCMALLAAQGYAQVTTGSLSGFVWDPNRRPVPGAALKVSDRMHSLVRPVTTDNAGFYRLAEMSPSEYEVTVSAAGFQAVTTAEVRVGVGSSTRVDFTLQVAGQRTAVEVKAQVRGVQTETADLAAVLDQTTVSNLPLNQRDFLRLGLLTAGVLPPVQDSELSTRGSFAMHANGGREEFNNYLLDGVDNNDQTNNRYVLQPPIDSIQEFKIATNNYAAEYGRSAAGQVNVLTRGGSNQWHGSVYEYLRNRALDWPNYFDAGEKAKYIRNQFGAGLGGPAIREKSFFFASFDGLRARQGMTRLATVPSAAVRSGDLSGLGGVISDPFTGEPFPQNRIPANRISPVARQILSLYPAANLSGDAGNYLAQPVSSATQSQFSGRLDQYLTVRDQLTLRYSYGRSDLFEPYAEQSTDVPGFGDYPKDRGHNAMLHHQHTFGPRTTNSLLLGLNRATRSVQSQNYQTDVNKLWGVSYLPTQARDYGYPSIGVAGYSLVGDVTQLPIMRTATTYQAADVLSLVRQNHSLKLGGEVRNVRNNGVLDILSRGSLSFSGDISGSGPSDLLLGYPVFAIQSRSDNTQTQRTTGYSAFFQDDWKIGPKLTLNLGVRYEFNTPATDPTNRMTVFDLQRMDLVRVGTEGLSRSGIRADRNNLAPRLGFAWSLTPTTVLRGGYGIFYDCGTLMVSSAAYFNPPYFNIYVFFPSAAGLLTLNNPFPTQNGMLPPASLSSFSPDLTTAYLQHWNLNLQREIKGAGTLSLAYAASKGTHLIRSRDLNQPRPGAGDVGSRSPYPEFSNIFFSESGANSEYQSLQASFHRPLSRGATLIGLYTFSKSIDDTSAFLSTTADKNFPQDSRNFRLDRGLSSFDMTHRATLAVVQKLPGRNRLTRGFQTSGILVIQSGQPFTPLLQFDNSNTGNTGGNFGSDHPNVLRNPALSNPSPDRWFDTSAFAVPEQYTFGNAGRNIVRGPGLATVDVSLSRQFTLAERGSLQFQAQAFNLLNRANFDLPEHFADAPATFGKIFSAKAPRQVQFSLRFSF